MASTYLSLNVHVIFSTKDRKPLIAKNWQGELHSYLGGTIRGLGASTLAIGGVEDHVHLLLGIRAVQPIADIVREIKKSSSGWAAQRAPGFAWQSGYGAFSVGHGELNRIKTYIANQEEHHKTVSSQDEFRAILEEFGIEIDERFFE